MPAAAQNPADTCDVFVANLDRVTARRRALVAPATATALADTFRALGDPTRVRMLDALAHGELCVCDLAAVVGLSESAVSHQLRLLRALRLVRGERRGRQVFYALDDQHILDLVAQGRRHVEEGGAAPASPKPVPSGLSAAEGGVEGGVEG
jgi:ArsR family transcriptional regulator